MRSAHSIMFTINTKFPLYSEKRAFLKVNALVYAVLRFMHTINNIDF